MTPRAAFAWLLVVLQVPLLVTRVVMSMNLPAHNERDLFASIWLAGAANDLLAIALLISVVALLSALSARLHRPAVTGVVCVALLIAILDLFFWFEFGNRTDRLVFHYLSYPVEVAAFLEDQFHLSLIALPIVIALAAIHLGTRSIADGLDRIPRRTRSIAAVVILMPMGAVAFTSEGAPIRPTLSRAINESASNGLLNVIHAALVQESRWRGVFPELAPVQQAELLPDQVIATPAKVPRHVMLIVEESFGGDAWWDPQARRRYMPEFDALRRTGVYFDRMYATGTRTTRGLEALLHGYPPLPGIALNQRTGFERLPSLPRAMARHGFDTVFVYGGWPGFSNFENYWRGIGFADVLTRDDFPTERFETSWGVADEMLFDRIIDEMDRRTNEDARVFLATLTVSNHRPFEFPGDRIAFPAKGRRLEYAIAYADWALGRFMKQAATRSWYADTLFVIVSDHAPRAHGDGLIPVNTFRVPGLAIWPAGLPPGERQSIASLVDVPRTILTTLGVQSNERFFGRDLLTADGDGVAPVEHDYRLGLLTDRGLTLLLRGAPPVQFVFDANGSWAQRALDEPALHTTVALFQTAFERWSDGPVTAQAFAAPAAAEPRSDRAPSVSRRVEPGG